MEDFKKLYKQNQRNYQTFIIKLHEVMTIHQWLKEREKELLVLKDTLPDQIDDETREICDKMERRDLLEIPLGIFYPIKTIYD